MLMGAYRTKAGLNIFTIGDLVSLLHAEIAKSLGGPGPNNDYNLAMPDPAVGEASSILATPVPVRCPSPLHGNGFGQPRAMTVLLGVKEHMCHLGIHVLAFKRCMQAVNKSESEPS
jgi:hypothetical protein